MMEQALAHAKARIVVEAAPPYVPLTMLMPAHLRCILNDTAGHVANYLSVISRPRLWGALENAFYENVRTAYPPSVVRAGLWARAVIDARRECRCASIKTCVDDLVREQLPKIPGLFGMHQRLLAMSIDFLMHAGVILKRYHENGTIYCISSEACAPQSFIKGLVLECVDYDIPMLLHKVKPPPGRHEEVGHDLVLWRPK